LNSCGRGGGASIRMRVPAPSMGGFALILTMKHRKGASAMRGAQGSLAYRWAVIIEVGAIAVGATALGWELASYLAAYLHGIWHSSRTLVRAPTKGRSVKYKKVAK
jgi:hypothetical protein